jgi:hypothetical protein
MSDEESRESGVRIQNPESRSQEGKRNLPYSF